MPKGIFQRKTAIERFWIKVQKTPDCWNWIASHSTNGYGRLMHKNKYVAAHRWSYESLVGPIPDGLVIDHLCRNKLCVNPAHMEPVTQRENVMRGEGIAAQNANKTHCVHGHEFNRENTYIYKTKYGPGRGCKSCGIKRKRESRRQKKIKNTTDSALE